MDKDIKKIQIQQVIDSPGWVHIEEFIKQRIAIAKDATTVSSSSRNDVYAREVRAGVKTAEHLTNILKQIHLLGQERKQRTVEDYD